MEAEDSTETSATVGPLGTPRFLVRDRHLLIAAALGAVLLIFAGYWTWSGSWRRPAVKDTMSRLRNAATALESARSRTRQYPIAEDWTDLALLPDRPEGSDFPPEVTERPFEDGWGHAIEYRGDGATYEMRSLGRDGVAQPFARFCGEMATVDDEMIVSDGSFLPIRLTHTAIS